MDNQLDYMIKSALSNEVKELSDEDDIFQRIEVDIKTEVYQKRKDYKHYLIGFSRKKYILITACLLIVCTALMFASSNQARALATKAISSIKTIFTIETKGDKLQIVEKPADEAYFINSVGGSTQESDEEIAEKLGFTVRFPDTLGNSFKLEDKNLGVVLRKEVDYETGSSLQKDMVNAIEDDNALNQLKPYDAARFVSGVYRKPDSSIFYINIDQAWKLSDIVNQVENIQNVQDVVIQKVKVDNLSGYWIKRPVPYYPTKIDNDIGRSVMTVQPEIKVKYTLYWEKSDLTYTLNTDKDFNLTLGESIKIAEDFMKAN